MASGALLLENAWTQCEGPSPGQKQQHVIESFTV